MDHGDSDGLFQISKPLPACYFIADNINRVVPFVGGIVRVLEQIDPGYSVVWVAVLEVFVAIGHSGGC